MKSPAKKVTTATFDDFLKVMKDHMTELTKHDVRSTFANLKVPAEDVFVKMMTVEMEGKKDDKMRPAGSKEKNASVIGTNLYEVEMKQLHDMHEGKCPDHVMILAESGEGKSTLAKRYARFVSEHPEMTNSLKKINMVHYVQVSKLQSSSKCDAFDLLFTQQVGSLMTKDHQKIGKLWMEDNAGETLIVIDGLDQSGKVFGGNYAKVSSETKADSNTILANLLSGHIFPGLKILSTARWNTFWKLDKEQKAPKTVGLRGFDDEKIRHLVTGLCDQSEKVIHYLWKRAPQLLLLCKTPMLLIYVVEVLIRDPENVPQTLSEIMVLVLKYFAGSPHKTPIKNYMQKLSKLAFHGMVDNRFVFSANYVSNLGLKFEELKDLVEPNAVLEPYQQKVDESDLEIQYNHQSIQEVLSALHIINMGLSNFQEFVKDDLNHFKMREVRKFTYGILTNGDVMAKAMPWIQGDEDNIKKKRELAEGQLISYLEGNVLKDQHLLSLLHECGQDILEKFGTKIHRICITDEPTNPGENHAVASVLKKCSSLTEVKFQSLEPNPGMIETLIATATAVQQFSVGQMIVGEQIEVEDCRKLAQLLQTIGIGMLSLRCSDAVAVDLCKLMEHVEVSWLDIEYNTKLHAETFKHIANIASKLKVKYIIMQECELTSEKLANFSSNLEPGLKIDAWWIDRNKSIQPDGLQYIAEVIERANVQNVYMGGCELTAAHLRVFSDSIRGKNLKMESLRLGTDKALEPEAFHHVVDVMQNIRLKFLMFSKCEMNSNQLQAFSSFLAESSNQTKVLCFNEITFIPSDLRFVIDVVQSGDFKGLWFDDCDLSNDHLLQLGESLLHKNIKLKGLWIDQTVQNPSDEQMSTLCQLLPNTAKLGLPGWKMNEQQCGMLQSELDKLPVSGMKIVLTDEKGKYVYLTQNSSDTDSDQFITPDSGTTSTDSSDDSVSSETSMAEDTTQQRSTVDTALTTQGQKWIKRCVIA